jgi:hypothetical protein
MRAARMEEGGEAAGGLSRLLGRGPAGTAVGLALRFLLARLLSVLTLVAVAFFLSPASFATLGLYLALANLLWLAAFARYEGAIMAVPGEPAARAAARLCAAIGSGVWALTACGAMVAVSAGLVSPAIGALFLLSLAARMLLRLSAAAATRRGDYRALGRTSFAHALAQPPALLISVQLLDDGALALVIADAVGHASAALALAWRERGFLRASLASGWAPRALLRTARTFATLPLYNLPGALLALTFVTLPLVLMPLVADPTLAGLVALAMRIFDVPTQIIGAATTPVLLNRLRGDPARAGQIVGRGLVLGLAGVVLATYAALAAALLVGIPYLPGFTYDGLVAIVPAVALFQAAVALAAPLAEACGLFPNQRAATAIHAAALATAVIGGGAAAFLSPVFGLAILGLVALARALSFGERLTSLSRDTRDEALFGAFARSV